MIKPAIILIRPQMGENIGAAARVMLNFELKDLRIVEPRDGWPNKQAIAMSASAVSVIEKAKIFNSLEEAAKDLDFLYATTARERGMDKEVVETADFPKHLAKKSRGRRKIGIVFGPERSGLTNEEVVLSDVILTFSVNPECPSLNLAQAVALVSYEISKLNIKPKPAKKPKAGDEAVDKKELYKFFKYLEQELDKKGFFKSGDMKPVMWSNLRNTLSKMQLSKHDFSRFIGVLRALAGLDNRKGK